MATADSRATVARPTTASQWRAAASVLREFANNWDDLAERQHEPADCPFCDRIFAANYIGCGRDTVAFEPLNPVTPGHMLFVPIKHVMHAGVAPWLTAQVMEVAADYAHAQGGDFNLITSRGPAATQTVGHLHVHYVPRREGDGLTLPWTQLHMDGTPR